MSPIILYLAFGGCRFCMLPCRFSQDTCPPGTGYADILEFKLVALPSGIAANQDLVRLAAYDQYRNHLADTVFTIIENDVLIPFGIRPDEGKGIVYAQRPLVEKGQHRIVVRARSYETRNSRRELQYQTTFIIFISVSRYNY